MNAALVHRGPDEGSVDAFGRCVLGHRRLQVIDLATGSQPVANEAGDVVAVFNGELYNFRELRGGARAGHEVRGTGDTPVIPHLYEEHGPAFVERARGDVRDRALGRRRASGSCSPATASARSRCSGRGCRTGRSRSPPS